MADTIQGSENKNYSVGDGVLAQWSDDGQWRRGVIQTIEDDEATVTSSEECLVQPTRVNIASLKPSIVSSLMEKTPGINSECNVSGVPSNQVKKSGPVEEVFYHKDVEAWMEKIVKQGGNDSKASSLLSRVAQAPPVQHNLVAPPVQHNLVAPPVQHNLVKMESTCPSNQGGSKNGANGLAEAKNNSKVTFFNFPPISSNNSIKMLPNLNTRSLPLTQPSIPKAMPSNHSGSSLPGSHLVNTSTSPGNLATMARTGRGSRYLQSLLVTTPASIPQIFSELMADAVSAMTHPKACFVVQKLLDVSDSTAIGQIIQVVAQNFSHLSLNQFGCHVVQKALTVAPNPSVLVIQLEKYQVLMNLLHSPHGTHVAQACIPLLPPRTSAFIVNVVRGQVVNIGRNQHGTYFLQKMVDANSMDGTGVNIIVEEILRHVAELAHDQNGTWLVQALLKSGDAAVRRLAHWVITNLLTIYRSQPSMFLALALVEKLREKCKASQSWSLLLADLVVTMAERHVGGKPLLVAAALHQTGHLLAREVARQVTYLGNGRARDRIVEVVTRYKTTLASDSYGNLVLKGLHEASTCYNLALQK